MSNVVRVTAMAMAFSASYFATTLVQDEYFTPHAVIPVQGDKPTYGFGSTVKADGTPVKMGDRITPTEAVALSYSHLAKDELRLKQCVTGDVSRIEWDLLLDHAYQYGAEVTCGSSIVAGINAGQYEQSCNGYADFRYMTSKKPMPGWEPYIKSGVKRWRYDCSTVIDGKRNKVCWGVWKRSLERRDKCLEGLQ